MANAAVVATHRVPGPTALGLIGRLRSAVETSLAALSAEIAESRRELKLKQAMRGFDGRHLRDLGLDRNAC